MRKNVSGFTIVELLIVIVVIAILAAISIVAYTGIQVRARDNVRTDNIAGIKKALELYRIDNGQYPYATINPGWAGWEASDDVAGSFMEYLKPYGFSGASMNLVDNATYRIMYHRYPEGGYGNGCNISKGGFYVLIATFENAANKPKGLTTVPDCTSPQAGWMDTNDTWYGTHAFEN